MFWLLLFGCSDSVSSKFPDRIPGDRTPLSASCDDVDPARCLLPWPSSTFTVADPSRPTGLRVAIDPEVVPDDDPTWLNRADGFSRVTPVATVLPSAVDPASVQAALRVFVSYRDGQIVAEEQAIWTEVVQEPSEALLIGYTLDPLPANADVVVVLTQGVVADPPVQAGDLDRVVLGLQAPANDEEARLQAWHAPTRRLLQDAGIVAEEVVRAWSFTTRSAEGPGALLGAMIAAGESVTPTVEIDAVQAGNDPVLLVVEGRLVGLPDFLDDGWVRADESGAPILVGTREAPFRVVIPAGEGDYPVALFGHGTGGDFHDSTFDSTIAGGGYAKLAGTFHGWTGDELLDSMIALKHTLDGTARSTSGLLQSVADMEAILVAMEGPLGDVLSADTLGDVPNPAAGRRPSADTPIWVGGSLGGTIGAVLLPASSRLQYGVLNVPTGGWSHIIPRASLYEQFVGALLTAWYPSQVDARLAIVQTQLGWDEVDGAAIGPGDAVALMQESIGDPVVPNAGTAILARAWGATRVGVALDEAGAALPEAAVVQDAVGFTQFRTDATDDYDIHGFAATNSEAGAAAMEQIAAFLASVQAGHPEITEPSRCQEHGSCDFAE